LWPGAIAGVTPADLGAAQQPVGLVDASLDPPSQLAGLVIAGPETHQQNGASDLEQRGQTRQHFSAAVEREMRRTPIKQLRQRSQQRAVLRRENRPRNRCTIDPVWGRELGHDWTHPRAKTPRRKSSTPDRSTLPAPSVA
jgi:hypothetical protein